MRFLHIVSTFVIKRLGMVATLGHINSKIVDARSRVEH